MLGIHKYLFITHGPLSLSVPVTNPDVSFSKIEIRCVADIHLGHLFVVMSFSRRSLFLRPPCCAEPQRCLNVAGVIAIPTLTSIPEVWRARTAVESGTR